MECNITPMQERHLPALAAIEQACFNPPWSEAALREELGKGIFLVAESDGTVIGYAGCQTVLDEGYITNIAVMADRRRQGIGRKLLSCLLAQAREQELSFVTLEVRPSNRPAILLYQKMGFVCAGTRKLFYRNPPEDALLMTWNNMEGLV